MKKEITCAMCGNHEMAKNVIYNGKKICTDCYIFIDTKLSRNIHYIWMIQFALDKLEDMINKTQNEIIMNVAKEYEDLPYHQYKLDNDSREKRIKQSKEFLNQYYEIHTYLKQMYKIFRHQDMISSAEAIVDAIKKGGIFL